MVILLLSSLFKYDKYRTTLFQYLRSTHCLTTVTFNLRWPDLFTGDDLQFKWSLVMYSALLGTLAAQAFISFAVSKISPAVVTLFLVFQVRYNVVLVNLIITITTMST